MHSIYCIYTIVFCVFYKYYLFNVQIYIHTREIFASYTIISGHIHILYREEFLFGDWQNDRHIVGLYFDKFI